MLALCLGFTECFENEQPFLWRHDAQGDYLDVRFVRFVQPAESNLVADLVRQKGLQSGPLILLRLICSNSLSALGLAQLSLSRWPLRLAWFGWRPANKCTSSERATAKGFAVGAKTPSDTNVCVPSGSRHCLQVCVIVYLRPCW